MVSSSAVTVILMTVLPCARLAWNPAALSASVSALPSPSKYATVAAFVVGVTVTCVTVFATDAV